MKKPKTPAELGPDIMFRKLKNFVHKLVNQFLRTYNLDREEVTSAAYLGFAQAYHSYDRKFKTKMITWVGEKVKKRMLDVLVKSIDDHEVKIISLDLIEHDVQEKEIREFDADDWLLFLTKRSRKVAKLVLYSPIDIKLLRVQLGEDSPGNWRQALRIFLWECGWNDDQIKAAFLEIKEAL